MIAYLSDMAIMDIIKIPDPVLKTVADPVDAVDDAVRALMDDMLETMYDAPGIGLAAPQVGVLKRVIVADVAKREASEDGPAVAPEPIFLANPTPYWVILEIEAVKRVRLYLEARPGARPRIDAVGLLEE